MNNQFLRLEDAGAKPAFLERSVKYFKCWENPKVYWGGNLATYVWFFVGDLIEKSGRLASVTWQ
jgi:hypothetical protein